MSLHAARSIPLRDPRLQDRHDAGGRPAGQSGGMEPAQHGACSPAMLEGASDEELMALVATGERAAFRALMGRHMRRAIRIAQGVVITAADADDIGQEVFVRVWRHAGSFDPARGRFTTWMHQIVINLAIDRKRRVPADPIELAEEIPDGTPGALAALIDAEEQAALRAALNEMPDRQRAALTLFHFEGMSGRECAQAMSVSESAFESLLTRARATLKQSVAAMQRQRRRNR